MDTTPVLHHRSSIEELYKQSQYFITRMPYQYFSDSFTEFVTILNGNREIVFCSQPIVTYLNAVDAHSIIEKRPGEALQCQYSNCTVVGCGASDFCTMCGTHQAIQKSRQGIAVTQECRIIAKPHTNDWNLSLKSTPFPVFGESFTIFAMKDTSSEKRRNVLENFFFHDILNVIGGLRGYSELLNDASPEAVREFASIINKLSINLSDHIESQRELVNAEQGRTTISPSLIHAKSLIDSIVQTFRMHNVSRNKCILVDPSAEDFIFISDETILRRVIGNLTKNALEATAQQTTVLLLCKRTRTEILFSVLNEGVMPRNIQPQVFQRSFSTKGEGRGLGTYSVKLFTEQYLGGKVSFVSNDNDGTIFTVSLPLSAALERGFKEKSDALLEEVLV